MGATVVTGFQEVTPLPQSSSFWVSSSGRVLTSLRDLCDLLSQFSFRVFGVFGVFGG